VTPKPSVSLFELLVELASHAGRGAAVDENIAGSLEQSAAMLRDVADALDRLARRAKGEAAQHGADEELLSETVRRLRPAREQARRAIPPPRAPRRPRLEESPDRADRERAAAARALLLENPAQSDYAIGRRAGVHRDVVERLRKGLRKASGAQEVGEKGSARERQ
jgi:hypothetical protein